MNDTLGLLEEARQPQVGSLRVVRACNGVQVRSVRTEQVVRLAASKTLAGLTVRRQNVYRLRR